MRCRMNKCFNDINSYMTELKKVLSDIEDNEKHISTDQEKNNTIFT